MSTINLKFLGVLHSDSIKLITAFSKAFNGEKSFSSSYVIACFHEATFHFAVKYASSIIEIDVQIR